MITSWNGNILRVAGHLCWEFKGHRWIPFFLLRLSERLSKQSWGWWFETPSHPLWRHCNDASMHFKKTHSYSIEENSNCFINRIWRNTFTVRIFLLFVVVNFQSNFTSIYFRVTSLVLTQSSHDWHNVIEATCNMNELYESNNNRIDDLVQKYSISIANALKIFPSWNHSLLTHTLFQKYCYFS